MVAIAVPFLAPLSGIGSAFAAEDEAADAPQPTLVAAPETPVFAAEAEQLRFELVLRNPGDEPVEGGEIVLSIDNERAEQASDLGSESVRESLELARVTASATPGGDEQSLEVTVQRSDVPLWFSRPPGVYPVTAEFVPQDEDAPSDADPPIEPATVPATTSLIWESVDALEPVPLTLVVPLVLPSTITTLPTAEQLTALAPSLTALLDAAEERHATLAVDPRIVAGIRALGSSAPATAITLLDRLERTPLSHFLLQYADADPAAQAALGFDSLLQPIGLSYAVVPESTQPEPAQPESTQPDSPQPESDKVENDPALGEGEASPSRGVSSLVEDDAAGDPEAAAETDTGTAADTGKAELTALTELPGATPGAWPAGGRVDTATLGLLSAAGLSSLVLESDNVSNATGTRANLGDFELLIADSAAAAAGRASLGGATSADRAAGTASLAALLALGAQNSSPGIVLALDRGAVADSADPLRIFDELDRLDWAQFVAAQLQPEGEAELRAGTTLEQRSEFLTAAVDRSQRIDELAPLLETPDYLLEYQRERLLEAFATRYSAPDADLAEADRLLRQRDEELLLGVQPVTSEHTQLVGTSSRVPITLNNTLPFDAAVSLRTAPTSAAIWISEQETEAIVPATGNTIVLVPVHSRVSSGESGISLDVRDAGGEQSFASGLQHLVLRTTVETIMLAALGASAALLFGFGIWRSIRARRQASAQSAAHSPE